MRISDWSSGVCSSDLAQEPAGHLCRWPGLEPRTRCQPRRRETMNRTILSPVLCVALAACASTRPASEIALDAPVEIEATPIANPPPPLRVVEMQTSFHLQAQHKPFPAAPQPPHPDHAHAISAAYPSSLHRTAQGSDLP